MTATAPYMAPESCRPDFHFTAQYHPQCLHTDHVYPARAMSKDLRRKGIYVNCVASGPTATELFMRNQTAQTLNILKSANPNRRTGEPEEIADSIARPCTSESRWVMG